MCSGNFTSHALSVHAGVLFDSEQNENIGRQQHDRLPRTKLIIQRVIIKRL